MAPLANPPAISPSLSLPVNLSTALLTADPTLPSANDFALAKD